MISILCSQAAESDEWPRHKVTRRVKHVFLIGQWEYVYAGLILDRLSQESRDHKDMVVLDFKDSYLSLSVKVMAGLR